MQLSKSHDGSRNRNYIIQMIFHFRQLRFLICQKQSLLDKFLIVFAGLLERHEKKVGIESSLIEIQSKVLLDSDEIEEEMTN